MLGISGLGISTYQNPYSTVYAARNAQRNSAAQQTRSATQAPAAKTVAIPAAQTGTPVQPVAPVKAPPAVQLDPEDMLRRLENDPAALAAKGRIQYTGNEGVVNSPEQTATQAPLPGMGAQEDVKFPGTAQAAQTDGVYDAQDDPAAQAGSILPETGAEKSDPAQPELPGGVKQFYDNDFPADEVKLPGEGKIAGLKDTSEGASETKSAQEVMEENECQTCKNRKYQDGSDDPGVSFKTPTHISPEAAPAAVRSHEMEHVSRNQAEAQREGRKVISQSVTYHTAICPECGRVYISGGTTRTSTAAQSEQTNYADQAAEDEKKGGVSGLLGAAA